MSDADLFAKGYNRVYDTLEMEANLNDVEKYAARAFEQLEGEPDVSSESICRMIGKLLAEETDGPGVLKSAYLKEVPVFIPAFTDCELGLDLATWAMRSAHERGEKDLTRLLEAYPRFNAFRDLASFARFAIAAKRLGIFTVGGGVPRNWAQEVGPFVDVANNRFTLGVKPPRYQYGVRLCPEPVHWGGLSGCTYAEGVSWGKFVPPEEGGRFAEVFADATAVWPLLVKAALETLEG